MQLGLFIGYSGAQMALPIEKVLLAERLGFDSVWTAEVYGSDAITPLAYLAAKTERIRLGTGIMQLAGRPAAMCAMQAQTVDALAGGDRVIAGLGVSGPQIVEGWYGEPWGNPYYRLQDYIQIMQKIFAREAPVTHDGREIKLPYPKDAPGAQGVGKALMSILHTNPNLPIWIGAGGPSTTRLAGELCQGIMPLGFGPGDFGHLAPNLLEGFKRAGGGKSWDGFEIQVGGLEVKITDNPKDAIEARKPGIALYVGGMGSKEENHHKMKMVEAGFPDEADKIQELYLAGKKAEAIAAVPDAYAERGMLIGTPEQIRERYKPWAQSGITGMSIRVDQHEAMELMADIVAETPAIGPAAALALTESTV